MAMPAGYSGDSGFEGGVGGEVGLDGGVGGGGRGVFFLHLGNGGVSFGRGAAAYEDSVGILGAGEGFKDLEAQAGVGASDEDDFGSCRRGHRSCYWGRRLQLRQSGNDARYWFDELSGIEC